MSQDRGVADVLIIGAGMSGLMAARVLEEGGLRITVLDKGRSVGGRMATRRIGPGVADHGAQFFTVKSEAFQEMVDSWIKDDLVFEWSNGFSDGSLMPEPREGHPRYAVNGGMNTLAKHLASELQDVETNVHIVTATCDEEGWILQDKGGQIYQGRALLMTPPVPQSLQILDEGATVLTRDDFSALSSIEYAPCLTGLFWIEGAVTLPQPGAIQRRNAHVTWIGDNHRKGISPNAVLVTVQASETYSTQMWNAPDGRVLNALRTHLEIFIREDAVIREAQLKRWRFSRPLNPLDVGAYMAENEPPLLFAGDAFHGARVEGAVLSGIAAGSKLLEMAK